jgi:hypothetical protein
MRTTCICPLLTSSSGRIAVVKGEFLPLLGIGSWSSNSEVVTVLTELSSELSTQILKYMKITPILDKLLEYKRNWIQHINRMPRNRLPRVMKHYSPTGRRNHDRPLKRLVDT